MARENTYCTFLVTGNYCEAGAGTTFTVLEAGRQQYHQIQKQSWA
jgi:hypothetical protein